MIFKSKLVKFPDPLKFLSFKFRAKNLSHAEYLEIRRFWDCIKNREWFFVAVFSELELLAKSVPLLEKNSLIIFSLLAWVAQPYQDYPVLDYYFVNGIKATKHFLKQNVPQIVEEYSPLRLKVFKEADLEDFPFLGLIPDLWIKSSFIRHHNFLVAIATYLNQKWRLPQEQVADFASNLEVYHFLHSQWQISQHRSQLSSIFNGENTTDLLLYKGRIFDKITAFLRYHYLHKFNDLVKLINRLLPH